MVKIEDVRSFWERNPLFSGESLEAPGSKEFFDHHRQVYVDDCFAGRLDHRFWPRPENCDAVLDLGCGPGFWTVEILRRCRVGRMVAADLTARAVELTRARLQIYGLHAETREENAEAVSLPDNSCGHVNCQGVIHHTPEPERAIAEIARVLRPGGTAVISVYYTNIVLRHWHVFVWIGRLMRRFGAGMPGRGREGIFGESSADEIVRLYDGSQNPLGKSYTKRQLLAVLERHFDIEDTYFHFFPARSLPFRLPRLLHRFLDRQLPFMIYVNCRKR